MEKFMWRKIDPTGIEIFPRVFQVVDYEFDFWNSRWRIEYSEQNSKNYPISMQVGISGFLKLLICWLWIRFHILEIENGGSNTAKKNYLTLIKIGI